MTDGSDLLAQRKRELERRLAELSPTKRASVERSWMEEGSAAPIGEERPRTIYPRDPAVATPMSFAQELFWLLERASPGHGYNVPRTSRFRGALNAAALQQALDTVVMRHEVLRTTYAMANDKPVQLIQPPTAVQVDRVDLRGWPAGEREAEAKREVRERSRRPFDLTSDLQLRVTLMTLAEEDHVLLLESHHAASDAWSHNILLREIAALYRSFSAGSPSTLAPIAVQYGDFAAWQREHFTAGRLEPLVAYWRRRLAGAPALLDLPTDRPRGAGISFDGATCSAVFAPELLDGLRRLSREQNVTLFMTLLAAFDVFLARICGQDDIVVGSPIAGRTLGDTEGIIGYFANMLILRNSVADDPTFSELLGRVRETALGAFDHQEVPFETLVMELSRDHTIARGVPFNVMFTLQDVELESLRLEGTTLTPFGSNRGATKFDLSLFARESAEGLRVAFEFRTDLFDATTIDRMLEQLHVLLAAIVADAGVPVSTLPLLSPAARADALALWNDTDAEFPSDRSLGQLLADQAARTPEAVAVEAESANGSVTRLTYAQLDRQAARLADRLRGIGVKPGVGVAICAERSPALVVAILGVLRSGGYYIPLDTEYPAERVAYMLDTAAPRVVLATGAFRDLGQPKARANGEESAPDARTVLVLDELADAEPDAPGMDPVASGAEDLAYVIYTSGSTGRPKGVMIPNRAVVNYLTWMQREYPLSGADAVLQKAPASFDACIWEFFLPLTTGARLVLARPGGHQDPVYLLDAIDRHDVTVLQLVPSQLTMILESGGAESAVALRRLRHLFLGGEALPPELLTRLRSRCPDLAVTNLYGPTEATVYSTHWSVPMGNWNEAEAPIGRPIANTRIYLLDKRMEPVPTGVPGELCISGAGVAQGYLNRPELTAERFVADQFTSSAGAMMYRTGDRARWRADGALLYMGRLDTQIKLRGFRIELGEIEYALVQGPEVQSAVAVVREDTPGDQRLVAYCVSASGDATQHAALTTSLRERLRQALPDYMIPSAVIWLETLPLNANGKLDRKALPAPAASDLPSGPAYQPPVTGTERMLVELFEDVLKCSPVGIHDNFFDLGGHSLLAMRVLSRVADRTGARLPLRTFFDVTTLAALAATIDRESAQPMAAPARIVAVSRDAFRRSSPAGDA